jgi:serine/threonine protein kinase
LKLDNIMVTFENQSVIETFVKGQAMHPMAQKRVGDRIVYRCHNDFGHIYDDDALKKMYPKIIDFDLAQQGDQPGPLVQPIQPDDYHAPEVILGTGWSYSADIWNFGVMVSILWFASSSAHSVSVVGVGAFRRKGDIQAKRHIPILRSTTPSRHDQIARSDTTRAYPA